MFLKIKSRVNLLDNLLISRVNDNLWEIIIVHDDMQLPVFLRDIKIR